MYLPLFLCLYESFWKGFEFDQRRLTLLVIKCVLLVWRIVNIKDAQVSSHVFSIVLKTFPRSSPKEIGS